MGVLENLQAGIDANNALLQDIEKKVTALQPTPTPTLTKGQFGFTANAFQSLSAADQALWLKDMKALGMSWLRFDANWHNIGSSNWGQLDQAVSAAAGAGINVCLILDGNGQSGMWVPPDPTAFALFCKTVVQRYVGKGVHTYEVWNEPNNSTFWSGGANPAQYTAVLKAAYAAIKNADPASTVLVGGLCPTGSVATWGVSFLKAMYAAGARGFFDAMNTHPYTYPAGPNDSVDSTWAQQYLATNQANTSILAVMATNGDGGKKIWMTEFGAPTATQSGNGVTELIQSVDLVAAIADVKLYSWAGPLMLYTYKDSGTDPTNNEDFFGIIRADGSQKPAYAAVKAAIAAN